MATRGRSFRTFPSRSRRQTGWQLGPGVLGLASITASSSVIFGAGFEFLRDGLTVVRIRGNIEINMTAATAGGDGYDGAFGIGIVSLPAFVAGVVSVPTPVTDVGWEGWMWHQYFSMHSPAAFDAAGENRLIIPIDTKAMRKAGTEEVIMLVGEFVENITSAITVTTDSRMLLKLP